MKYLISLILLLNFLNASMLLDSQNTCIDDFYLQNQTFYFLKSSNNTWYSSTDLEQVKTIIPNFIFDTELNKCVANPAFILGMQETEYNFLLGIVGVIFGAVFMFFTTQIFTTVGGRR
ncbi:hypothetical protein [Sulfurimonas xiamenensis]|uniref:Uncharacterized protein n=1 Tax=Sulfurimonas xiamenensis TaxID=2590021 RepID=A0AAJ4A4B7_9BACT|nr:hypothetical protein [Sulfurimonas xiamenensis]QFR43617.1 hypothetical protein FJR47_06715 [Sulfurimonas xiamenensis]